MKITKTVVKEQPKPNSSEHNDDDVPRVDDEESKNCCSCDTARCKLWCIKSYHPTKKFPMSVWIRDYQLGYIIRDVVAGLTIGLMLIPQSLAYAELAGLDAQFGLYTSFIGVSVYTVMGTSKQCAIGPTAISSALMREFLTRPSSWPTDIRYNGTSAPELAQMLAFFMGVILSSLGLLQLGFLVNFISASVVTGFIQAAAFTIPLGQLKKLFGVKSDADSFIGKIVDICQGLSNANWYDFGVGMGSILLLVLLKELKQRSGEWKCAQNVIISKIIWFLGTAKAAIVTILMMSIAIGIEGPIKSSDSSTTLTPIQNFLNGDCRPGTIIQNTTDSNSTNGIEAGCTILTLTKIQNVPAPQFGVPALMGYEYPYCKEGKADDVVPPEVCQDLTCPKGSCAAHSVSFSDMVGALSAGLIIQPIISYLELISLGKSFAKKDQYQIDSTQEMVALGASNLMNSFVYGVFPVTAGMSRSAVNYQANAATQLSAWVTAGVMCLACWLLADIFVYIPSAALAAVIIVSASSLFNFADWKRIWTLNKVDMVPFVVTFVFALRKSSLGLILGIITHLVILLGKFMMPVNRPESKKNVIYLEGMCMYPSGDDEHLRMLKVCGLPKTISINGAAPEIELKPMSTRSSIRMNKISPEDVESGIEDQADHSTEMTVTNNASRASSIASL